MGEMPLWEEEAVGEGNLSLTVVTTKEDSQGAVEDQPTVVAHWAWVLRDWL